jgi:AraC-like DNA-binding protein
LITNYFIPPHITLSPFVVNYILSTSENETVEFGGNWPASNETSLIFHLQDHPSSHLFKNSNADFAHKQNCIVGVLTESNGASYFNGKHHTFLIQFKANGFYKIFGIPSPEVTNKVFCSDDVFGNIAHSLHEQLLHATNVQEMAVFADAFLITFLNRQKAPYTYDGITSVVKDLIHACHVSSTRQYAYKANMSVRSFERRFMEQVGISPKLYSKLLRFNEAMIMKSMYPGKSWTSIAHECNYYDQMHLIKDFKQFSGYTPTEFFKENRVANNLDTNSPIIDSAKPNNNLPQEKFVVIKRSSF